MLQPVLPGVEVLISLLHRIQLLLYQLLSLLLSECFPVQALELSFKVFDFLLGFRLQLLLFLDVELTRALLESGCSQFLGL